jgi:hypothetical protein
LELLRLRVRALGRLLDAFLLLLGLGLSASGLVRGLQEWQQQPNSSLVVLALGLLLLAYAWRQPGRRRLAKAHTAEGRRQLRGLAWRFPTVLLGLFAFYRFQVRDLRAYGQLFAEGSVAEWLTFLFFLMAGTIALLVGWRGWQRGERRRGAYHMLFGLGCAVVGLEEMSWGQTLFNWTTPELFAAHNRQHETNLHNLAGINEHLWSATALVLSVAVALVGLRWLLQRQGRLSSDSLLDAVLPLPELLPLLLFAALVYVPVALEKQHGLDLPLLVTRDQEVAELAFSAACLIEASGRFLAQPLRWARRPSNLAVAQAP